MHDNRIPPRFLRTPEAARFLGLSGRTLEKHRTYGTGPIYHKLGGRIVYNIRDLQEWADRGKRHSTDDPGDDIVQPAKPQADDPRDVIPPPKPRPGSSPHNTHRH
jgi:hypothetical protein